MCIHITSHIFFSKQSYPTAKRAYIGNVYIHKYIHICIYVYVCMYTYVHL